MMLSMAISNIALARSIVGGIVRRMPFGSRSALQKGGTLRKDSLESVNVLLGHIIWPTANPRELNASEGSRVGAEIPPRDQVAARRLVIYLSCGRKGQVKLRREVEVKVEVFLGRRAGWFSV
jgi:hypothetical protein